MTGQVRTWSDITSGYRFSLVSGAGCCLFTLLINLAVTIWAATLPDPDSDNQGRRVLFQGSCKSSKELNAGLHALINILSSMLLGASNYGMQCLSSPTREQVDKAHAEGNCLDVGIISLKNLGRQGRVTKGLWYALVLSSVPLHLLYNSVVFASVTIAPTYTVLTTDEGAIPETIDYYLRLEKNTTLTPQLNRIAALENIGTSWKSFERLSTAECIDAYASSFVTSRSDVILIHANSTDGEEAKFIMPDLDGVGAYSEMYSWMCWASTTGEPCLDQLASLKKGNAEDWAPFRHKIGYCLSRTLPEELCRVNFNIWLAIVIIGVNAIKMGILVYTALHLSPDRLLVLGDAVQSFLSKVDIWSRQSCLAGVRYRLYAVDMQEPTQPWNGPRMMARRAKRWISPVSDLQLGIGALLYFLSFSVSTCLLVYGIDGLRSSGTWSDLLSLGFGQPNGRALLTRDTDARSSSPSIIPQAIIANIPHLTFSVIYFQWNTIFTSMLMGREWNNFGRRRAALRVSDQPKGAQRTRYFLQLPYKFTVPLMGVSVVLHWVLSQCIYVVSVEVWKNSYAGGQEEAELGWGLVTCGYSPLAIITCLCVSVTIPLSVMVVGGMKLKGPMPVAGSCSMTIAAACHHPDGQDHPDTALEPLAWGVMMDLKKQYSFSSQSEAESDDLKSESSSLTASSYEHCGFSNGMVTQPQEGRIYA